MSEIDREELRGLLEEATPGPWLYDNQGGKTDEFELFYQDLSYTNGPVIASLKGREEDAQLIALAPTLAAAYLDLLERVEAIDEIILDWRDKDISAPQAAFRVSQVLTRPQPVSEG